MKLLKSVINLLKIDKACLICVPTSNKSTKVWKEKYIRFRKPPWAPLAVTKLHKVNQRPEPGEENEELKMRFNHFRTIRKSLYHYFAMEAQKKDEIKLKEIEEIDRGRQTGTRMKEVQKLNDAWNKSILDNRAKLDEEELTRVEKEMEEVMLKLQKDKDDLEMDAQTKILLAMEKRDSFITEVDQLDKAIEVSLNSSKNHNFCIDLQGNKYYETIDGGLTGADGAASSGDGEEVDGGDDELNGLNTIKKNPNK